RGRSRLADGREQFLRDVSEPPRRCLGARRPRCLLEPGSKNSRRCRWPKEFYSIGGGSGGVVFLGVLCDDSSAKSSIVGLLKVLLPTHRLRPGLCFLVRHRRIRGRLARSDNRANVKFVASQL